MKTEDGLSVTAANVDLTLSDQSSNVSARGPPFLHLSSGSGSLTITSAGIDATISGRLQLSLPGISFDAAVTLSINTTTATPTFHLSTTARPT